MPGSHTSATVLPGLLPRDTLAATPPEVFTASWRQQFRVATGRGGSGVITGTVKIKGTPDYAVSRRVRLYRDRDGILVGETWSDPTTGAYSFDGLDRSQKYTVLALDHTGNFRAVPADNLTPEAA
jgi:hypothetical protein